MADKTNESVVIINGFSFVNKAEAEQAAKEAEGVRFIREKADMERPEAVLNIYHKMIEENLFETAVGISYLRELQEYLHSIPFISKEEVWPIPVLHPTLEESVKKRSKKPEEEQRGKEESKQKGIDKNYRNRYRLMRALSVIFAVCIAAMFMITATTNNTTILNYEQKLIDKYAEWEIELEEREDIVRAREAELGIKAE